MEIITLSQVLDHSMFTYNIWASHSAVKQDHIQFFKMVSKNKCVCVCGRGGK